MNEKEKMKQLLKDIKDVTFVLQINVPQAKKLQEICELLENCIDINSYDNVGLYHLVTMLEVFTKMSKTLPMLEDTYKKTAALTLLWKNEVQNNEQCT